MCDNKGDQMFLQPRFLAALFCVMASQGVLEYFPDTAACMDRSKVQNNESINSTLRYIILLQQNLKSVYLPTYLLTY